MSHKFTKCLSEPGSQLFFTLVQARQAHAGVPQVARCGYLRVYHRNGQVLGIPEDICHSVFWLIWHNFGDIVVKCCISCQLSYP